MIKLLAHLKLINRNEERIQTNTSFCEPGAVKVKSPSERLISISCGSADFLAPQNSALILDA